MTRTAVMELRRALRAALIADSALVALLGGARVYDEVPREKPYPCLVFGNVQARDWSASCSAGCEQFIILDAYDEDHGMGRTLGIADRVAVILDEACLTLQGHHLVDLRFLSTDARRESNGRIARASVRLRAVTEQLI